MSKTRLDGFLGSIREFVRPSSRESGKASSIYRSPSRTKEYGIFTLGKEGPSEGYNLELSISLGSA